MPRYNQTSHQLMANAFKRVRTQIRNQDASYICLSLGDLCGRGIIHPIERDRCIKYVERMLGKSDCYEDWIGKKFPKTFREMYKIWRPSRGWSSPKNNRRVSPFSAGRIQWLNHIIKVLES